MNEFYVYLFSNSSRAYYRNNTLSHFRTKLSRRIDLDENWKCGISEIVYNSSTSESRFAFESLISQDKNVNYNSLKLEASDGESEVIKFPRQDFLSLEHMFSVMFSLVKNHHLGQQMVDQLIKLIQYKSSTANTVHFEPPYNADAHTNTLTYKNHVIRFAVAEYKSISEFFDEIEKFAINKKIRIELLSNAMLILLNNVNYFYKLSLHTHESVLSHVYCNIIDSVFSGDSLSKSIRVAQLKRRGGEILFNPIYYHKLSHYGFDMIEIGICNDDGEYINFRPSDKPTLIVLHFKKN